MTASADGSHQLPSDDEFLARLDAFYRNDAYVKHMDASVETRAAIESVIQDLVQRGIIRDVERRAATDHLLGSITIGLEREGHLVQSLRAHALLILARWSAKLENVRVWLLPHEGFNAQAILRTPRGGKAIILNHGVIAVLSPFVHAFLGAFTWDNENPYCQDHSREEHYATVYHLCAGVVSGNPIFLKWITTFNDPLPITEQGINEYSIAFTIQTLILLHEYGHIALGHTSVADLRREILGDGLSTDFYGLSRFQEFQADWFAFHEFDVSGEYPGPLSQLLWTFGILLGFLRVCEALAGNPPTPQQETHPSAGERWGALLAPYRNDLRGVRQFQDLDNFFDFLVEAAKSVGLGRIQFEFPL